MMNRLRHGTIRRNSRRRLRQWRRQAFLNRAKEASGRFVFFWAKHEAFGMTKQKPVVVVVVVGGRGQDEVVLVVESEQSWIDAVSKFSFGCDRQSLRDEAGEGLRLFLG